MRKLTQDELRKLEFLTSQDIEVGTIEPTETGLSKSIFDATQTVRDFLLRNNIHDYENQGQGPDNKIVLSGFIVSSEGYIDSSVSLYRPQTKSGDHRIWFSKITSVCEPSDILAFWFFDSKFWIFNLSQTTLEELASDEGPFAELFSEYQSDNSGVSAELLSKLTDISSLGFIKATVEADTAIGRLLEQQLGIDMNSNKTPDYKGIEIKSFRASRSNRKNLFAQVADWNLSHYKSSKEMLDHFGYDRDGVRKLYCTVNANTQNSQGLRLRIDEKKGVLIEFSVQTPEIDALVWKFQKLNERLIEKHSETFWVQAEVQRRKDGEWFKFSKVEHTKKPIVSQLPVLLNSAHITLDHLIKENKTSAQEKGPIFKLSNDGLPLLFPPSSSTKLN